MKTYILIFMMVFFIGCESGLELLYTMQSWYRDLYSECYNPFKPTVFFKIKEERFTRGGWEELRISFVISNPPRDKRMLKKVVEEHNFQTISPNKLKKYGEYEIEFYRETHCLTRNYKEGAPYPELRGWRWIFLFSCNTEYNGDDPGQQLRYHYYSGDHIMSTIYSSRFHDVFWAYRYDYGTGDLEERERVTIKDIDLYFKEKITTINNR